MEVDQKRKALAKLFGMVNAGVMDVNKNDPHGNPASEELAMEGISRNEFLAAMNSVNSYKSEGFTKGRANPVPVGPEIGEPVSEEKDLSGSDVLLTLKSIDATLNSILQVLLSFGQPKEKQ